MATISIILLVLFGIVSILTIFIISIQSEDSSGVGGVFAGGSDSVFGGQTSKTINKATGVLIGVFFLVAILFAVFNKTRISDLSRYETAAPAANEEVVSDEAVSDEVVPGESENTLSDDTVEKTVEE